MLNKYQEKIALEILVSRVMLHTCKVQHIIWSNKYWLLTLATWILATRWRHVTPYLLRFTSVYRPNVAWSLLSGTMFCCLLFDDHSSVHSCVDSVQHCKPYCYYCLSLQFVCLVLHVCEPVGVSVCHNHDWERMGRTWVRWSPFHSRVHPWWPLVVSSFSNGHRLAASLSRLCIIFLVHQASSMCLFLYSVSHRICLQTSVFKLSIYHKDPLLLIIPYISITHETPSFFFWTAFIFSLN